MREFQYKFLLALVLVAAAFTTALVAAHLGGLHRLEGPHLHALMGFTLLALGCWAALRSRLERFFSVAIDVGGHSLQITASIGVAHSPDSHTDLQSLQQGADSAMYQARAAGRNRVTCLP